MSSSTLERRAQRRFVALITGASSGIGEATARRLARGPDVRLVLVARREQQLRTLAGQLGVESLVIPADLTAPDAPERIRTEVEREFGALHMLVNNAGASWRGDFAERGWSNLERHMQINFEAPVRLIDALLPLLRRTAAAAAQPGGGNGGRRAPVSIVNVASTAARVSRPRVGAYSASKFALAGWSDALHGEERPHGVHVGLVLPGFVATEGFPQRELLAGFATRWLVSRPELVADAILEAGPGGKAERYVPRYYWIAAAARILAPALVRRATSGGTFSPSSASRGD
jgi:short-subunit dehydrogenase